MTSETAGALSLVSHAGHRAVSATWRMSRYDVERFIGLRRNTYGMCRRIRLRLYGTACGSSPQKVIPDPTFSVFV